MTTKLHSDRLGEKVPGRVPFADPADFLLPGWDRAVKAIRSLHALAPNWDGAGGRSVSADKLASAVLLCRLMRESRMPAPTGVYPLADGNLMLEWRFANGVVTRFEIESPGRGEFMTTFPDDRRAQFQDYHWGTEAAAFQQIGNAQPRSPVATPRPKRGSGPCESFSLAA